MDDDIFKKWLVYDLRYRRWWWVCCVGVAGGEEEERLYVRSDGRGNSVLEMVVRTSSRLLEGVGTGAGSNWNE